MKKIFVLSLTFFFILTLSACRNAIAIDCKIEPNHVDCIVDSIEYLDIFYINDFHGSILDSTDEIGMANIANFLITSKEANPENTIIIAGGDILQGSALSNYYSGLSTITLMNEMYFDAFTAGNHEFDWGIDVVTNYFDGVNDNGEANFPLLGANIFYKGTTNIPDGIEPYTIIERGDLKIGIIGTMGYGLEYSIATSKIEDYEFALPVPIIEQYSTYLRTEESVDIILVVSHDSGSTLNMQVAALSGDSRVDAIFNAHSHSLYAQSNLGIPVLQSGSNGEYVGHVRLNITDGFVTDYIVKNLGFYDSALLRSPNDIVLELIEHYQLETDTLFNTPIITADEYLSTNNLSNWIAELMRVSTGSDIGFQNSGGTRTSVEDGTVLTLSVLYQIWPFDNVVKTVYLTGAEIKNLIGSLVYSTDITSFDDATIYKVATNDYTFDKTSNPFIYGESPENTGLLLRDLAEDELILQSYLYDFFYINNEILTENLIP